MLNLSPLFFTMVGDYECFHSALDLTPTQRTELANAKNMVRNCLRSGIPQALRESGYTPEAPEPRFFTQGSWSYKTLNAPAQHPQQADLDDGCYLPMSFMTQTQRPSVAAMVFFDATEKALKQLVDDQGWTLVTDKTTCVRIVISKYAHIDIPLYAIPDEEFAALRRYALDSRGYPSLEEAVTFAERDAWTALPKNRVLLAHREDNWKMSDPRPVKVWFLGEVDAKGDQLRRIVRYLKAFRDWTWPCGGPTSILLMAAAAPVFEKHTGRDDLALLSTVSGLPTKLREGINNPVDSEESLTDRLGKSGVEEAAKAFERLEKMLSGAIHASSATQACCWMRDMFGQRFPYIPSQVKVISVAATIASAPAMAGPSEIVGRTKAG